MKIISALAIIASAGSTFAAESVSIFCNVSLSCAYDMFIFEMSHMTICSSHYRILYVQNNLREREQGDRKLFFSGGGGCGWAWWKSCPTTKYVANFGKYGKVVMKVKDGQFDMDINLKNIGVDFFGNTKDTDTGTIGPSKPSDKLAYHLHSGQAYGIGAKPDGTKEFCGPSYTSGHYDSNLGCGGASTARIEGKCVDSNNDVVPASGNADPPGNYPDWAAGVIDGGSGGCEVGDLSCVNGKLAISNNEKVNADVTGPCPDCVAEYLDPKTSNKQGAFDTWYSIVFHDGLTGARVLCANFRKV